MNGVGGDVVLGRRVGRGGHEREDGVKSHRAEGCEAVDEAEIYFARLFEELSEANLIKGDKEHTKARNTPNSSANSIGPARSESSIKCWSILAVGFNTVRVYSSRIVSAWFLL